MRQGMGQSANYAATKDVQIMRRKEVEGCAPGTGQRANYAKAKDARISCKKEVVEKDMGQRANYGCTNKARTRIRGMCYYRHGGKRHLCR